MRILADLYLRKRSTKQGKWMLNIATENLEKVYDFILLSLSPQRGTMRRRYEDDGISDDEIEGKRTFDLEEKLHTNKYNANFVTFMEGKGQYHLDSDLQPLDVGGCRFWELWAQHVCSQNTAC